MEYDFFDSHRLIDYDSEYSDYNDINALQYEEWNDEDSDDYQEKENETSSIYCIQEAAPKLQKTSTSTSNAIQALKPGSKPQRIVVEKLSRDSFLNTILSWSIAQLTCDDPKSRNACGTEMPPRPNVFDKFSQYCDYWFKFNLEEARATLKSRLSTLNTHSHNVKFWMRGELHVKLKCKIVESKKKDYYLLEFECMSPSLLEHKYACATYALSAHNSQHPESIIVMVPPNSPTGTAVSSKLQVAIHKKAWTGGVIRRLAGGKEGELEGSMFTLFPIENLMPTYRSALVCCEALPPAFVSRLLGQSQPSHLHFDEKRGHEIIDLTGDDQDEKKREVPMPKESDTKKAASDYHELVGATNLNGSQQQALNECMAVLSKPGSLTMVQGPPGTGKTHFLSCLLLELLNFTTHDEPENASVDVSVLGKRSRDEVDTNVCSRCTFVNHDTYVCDMCDEPLAKSLKTSRVFIKPKTIGVWCHCCRKPLHIDSLSGHLKGKKHRKNATARSLKESELNTLGDRLNTLSKEYVLVDNALNLFAALEAGEVWCSICSCPYRNVTEHTNSKAHNNAALRANALGRIASIPASEPTKKATNTRTQNIPALQPQEGLPPRLRILATGPSNKSVVVMLEKFMSVGGAQKARTTLFGVDDKLEGCSSGDVALVTDPDILNIITNQSPSELSDSKQLSLSILYENLRNPKSITDILARHISKLFTLALSNFQSYLQRFCKDHKGNLRQPRGISEIEYLVREYGYADHILDFIIPSKNLPYSLTSHHNLISSALATISCFASVPISTDESREDQADMQSLFADTLTNVDNYLSVFILRTAEKEVIERFTRSIIEHADVIFTTLSSAGNAMIKRCCPVDVVVCDEAAQASEASTLISLHLQPRHLILVGDPAQLPAFVESIHARSMKCEESLMKRLMTASKYTSHLLSTQYRMHPDIVEFPNRAFYSNHLNTHNSVNSRKMPWNLFPIQHWSPDHQLSRWVKMPYAFINFRAQENFGNSSSFSNTSEALFIVNMLEKLQNFYGTSYNLHTKCIVITFYAGQVDCIKRLLGSRKDALRRIKVFTVDGVQGSEADIVLLSFVRSNEEGNTGFLKNPNRLNVSLTRAKKQLLCVGNLETMLRSGSTSNVIESGIAEESILQTLVRDALSRNVVVEALPASFQSRTVVMAN